VQATFGFLFEAVCAAADLHVAHQRPVRHNAQLHGWQRADFDSQQAGYAHRCRRLRIQDKLFAQARFTVGLPDVVNVQDRFAVAAQNRRLITS